MKKNTAALFITVLGLFSISVGVYTYFFAENNFISRETQSAKKKSDLKKKTSESNSDRDLELGIISDVTTKVEDEPSVIFNDPAIKQAWGLKKIDAARAWSITKGSKDLIVAVIDTGIDANHEDLKDNLWQNPGETGLDKFGHDKASNGIDDDENGFVDDVHGWNFVSNNNKLTDNHGHGTHIAGIIGAVAGNKKGIVGISPEVSIMVLKYYDPKVPNTDNLKNTIQAMKYAVKMGAHIINYSGGGTEYSQEEHDAVQEAEKKGILFVAAAGNERSNSDKNHYYPADYNLKNIISVTAIDPTTEVLNSSNYGVETVDIAAPGQGILSCLPNNSYGVMTGTSQATAFVTGGAALVMAHKKLYNNAEEVKKFILATGDSNESLVGRTRTSRQLNLFKALTILGNDTNILGLTQTENADKKAYTQQTADSVDPNLNRNKTEVDQMTSFASELSSHLQLKNRRNKNGPQLKVPDRLGERIDTGEN